MTKDVLVAIKGLQFSSGEEPDNIEIINSGEYYMKNGKHYILYEEVSEGFDKTTKNMIKLSDGFCSVSKKGLVNVNMLFEENKKNLTNYATPFGNIMIGIDTQSVKVTEEDDSLNVLVDYALEANYEHLAHCKLTIEVKNKASGISLSTSSS